MSSNVTSANAQLIMFQFSCNPWIALDDDLQHALAFAWSLPPHPTFERKMASIQAAIDEAAAFSPWDYPRCWIFNFVHKIGDAVRDRIEIYRLQVHVTPSAIDESSGGEDEELDSTASDSEIPPLIY